MKVHEGLTVVGRVNFYLVRGDLDDQGVRELLAGEREALRVVRTNLVTNAGRREMAKRLTDQVGVTSPTHIAFGNVAYTPAVGDTALTGEFFRKVCSTVAPHQDYFGRWVLNALSTEANGTIRGAGLFTAASGGNMWAGVAANVVKTSSQSLVTEWTIEVRT